MNLQRLARCWKKIKSHTIKIFLAIVFLTLLLLTPISWLLPEYESGEDTEELAKQIAAIVNSHYPVSWESKNLILKSRRTRSPKSSDDRAPRGVQIDSRTSGEVAYIVSINVQEYELSDKAVNLNIGRYLASKLTSLAKSNESHVRCWCVDEDFYAYPACASVIILRPYRVETSVYHTSQRCLWGGSGEVPNAIFGKFTQVSQTIEGALKAKLNREH